jgi:hypothetical protein
MATARRLRTATAKARGTSREEVGVKRISVKAEDKKAKQVYHEEAREEEFEPAIFEDGEEPAFIRIGAGVTRDMGNYEFLRIDAAVTLPCSVADVRSTYAKASDLVCDMLTEEEEKWLPRK